ncbi:tyrosine-protein phosphatase [Simplicispira psychrophila]|uniref:tyrosine-protein phosphatase n=1 Tax=Simplicispira psychrophila TaxID=80882 RepID=UPI0006924AF3|nr:tyrosine-protein phosphatase [Simplicispira psychrophila]
MHTTPTAAPAEPPPRTIALSGASNFRDLGGYAGHGGRPLKWRHLFRADHLAALTPADLARLGELGITRSADFRGVTERAAQAYALPGVATHTLEIEPILIQQALQAQGDRLTAAQAVRLMHATYRSFVTEHAPRFAQLFELLLDSDAPLVFHCTAGKDRTGFAAALILLALGVPRAVVMQDYLLTNTLYRPPSHWGDAATTPAGLQVLWRVQEDFLEAALHGVEVEYGGIAPYLERVLGVNAAAQQRLVRLYLQP